MFDWMVRPRYFVFCVQARQMFPSLYCMVGFALPKFIARHYCSLNDIFHCLDHSNTALMLLWNISDSDMLSTVRYSGVSSAYRLTLQDRQSGKSLMLYLYSKSIFNF